MNRTQLNKAILAVDETQDLFSPLQPKNLTPRQGEEFLLKTVLKALDNNEGKYNGYITLKDIQGMRQKVDKNGGESLGFRNSSNRKLDTNTVNNILTFLETAIRRYGDPDGDSLNESQLISAMKAVPKKDVLFRGCFQID